MADKEKESLEAAHNLYNDPSYLAPNKTTNIELSSTLFDVPRNKLGFVDGTLKIPDKGPKDLARWNRGDHMVRCWLFRSMKEDIANDFILVESAKQLRDELLESNIKKEWDVIQELEEIP
ncbi:DNA-directed RNA polymerase subunit beta' [Bienertia sinuspersici]